LNYIEFEELATQDMTEPANHINHHLRVVRTVRARSVHGPSHAMRTTEDDDFSQLFDHLVQDLLSFVLGPKNFPADFGDFVLSRS
jgi:hypothetical protein